MGETSRSDCSISSRKARWKVMNGGPLCPCNVHGWGMQRCSVTAKTFPLLLLLLLLLPLLVRHAYLSG